MIQSEKGKQALENTYLSALRMPVMIFKQALVHFKGVTSQKGSKQLLHIIRLR